MITFATLFLGLVAGSSSVSVLVGPTVAAVAIELDGRTVGTATGPPWAVRVDFGEQYQPHELVAIAYDPEGQETGRARQWVNLPRPPAEVEILLERDPSGRAVAARFAWGSLLSAQPEKLSVTFDGTPLVVDAARRAELPLYETTLPHILSAELEFPGNLQARAAAVLGGGSADRAQTELTAIPVRVRKGSKPPPETRREGAFLHRGEPVPVAAIEKGRARVVLVRDLGLQEARARIGDRPRGGGRSGVDSRSLLRLPSEDRVSILWPVARPYIQKGVVAELFEGSRDFTPREGGFHFLLTRVSYSGDDDPPRRFTDAAAVAALNAFGSYARRAVVLVLGATSDDTSRHEPAMVRRYLETVRVPIHVWSLSGKKAKSAAAWGNPRDVSSYFGLSNAFDELKEDLDSQWIVWLEGRHLPHEVSLAPWVRGMELVE
ncbi:MAG TPA: hypothetical protein VIE39_02470 [Thermoanaerobaculia bacterium]